VPLYLPVFELARYASTHDVYWQGSSPLALAVSIRLKQVALAFAPVTSPYIYGGLYRAQVERTEYLFMTS
jgi:hypothetical protein